MSDAIPASTVRVSTMADGTLRLTMDVEPAHAQAAFRLFGAPGQPCAIAALKTAGQQQAAEQRAIGGEAARWLGIRCGEAAFRQWLAMTWPREYAEAVGRTENERAASVVRAVCCVESQAEIDNDKIAFTRFTVLIRRAWQEYTEAKG